MNQLINIILLLLLVFNSCNEAYDNSIYKTDLIINDTLPLSIGMSEKELKKIYNNRLFEPDYPQIDSYKYGVFDSVSFCGLSKTFSLIYFYLDDNKKVTDIMSFIIFEKDILYEHEVFKDTIIINEQIQAKVYISCKGLNIDTSLVCITYIIGQR